MRASETSTLVDQPRFRAGFDFLRLRADAHEASEELAEWWEDFSLGTDEERRALIEVAREQDAARRAAVAAATKAPTGSMESSLEQPAAKKRRRRRRKPVAGAPDASAPESDLSD
jgi:poly(A) polymerase